MFVPIARLPSLDLVRGFVAVGRRLSITLAAEDLCLTQSAVSRQIHSLEEVLGVKLFQRGHRSLHFTGEGERLFRVADASVRELQEVIGLLDSRQKHRPVTITLTTAVAALWLVPRLSELQEKYPQIEVRIAAIHRVLDLNAEGIDLAIRYCSTADAPLGAEPLFFDRQLVVFHPSMVESRDHPAEVIRNSVLLEYETRRPQMQWMHMLQCLGLDSVRPQAIMRFNQYEQVIQAAEAGQGLAIGRVPLLAPLLLNGRLAAFPVPKGMDDIAEAQCWLIRAQGEQRKEVDVVADWIKSEAAQLVESMKSL